MPTFKAVQDDAAGVLNGSGLTWCGVALVGGTNLFTGPERAASEGFPEAALWIREYGGQAPIPYLNSGRKAYVRAAVQVLGRCDKEQEGVGLADMRALMGFLQQKTVSGYVAVFVEQAAPAPWGLGEDNLYRWSFNMRWEYKAT